MILFGRVTETSFVLANAPAPISVTVEGMVIVEILVLPKALLPILTSPAGNVMLVRFPQL